MVVAQFGYVSRVFYSAKFWSSDTKWRAPWSCVVMSEFSCRFGIWMNITLSMNWQLLNQHFHNKLQIGNRINYVLLIYFLKCVAGRSTNMWLLCIPLKLVMLIDQPRSIRVATRTSFKCSRLVYSSAWIHFIYKFYIFLSVLGSYFRRTRNWPNRNIPWWFRFTIRKN